MNLEEIADEFNKLKHPLKAKSKDLKKINIIYKEIETLIGRDVSTDERMQVFNYFKQTKKSQEYTTMHDKLPIILRLAKEAGYQ